MLLSVSSMGPSGYEPSSLLPPQILVGFERLQAIARSHLLTKQFQAMRQRMVQLQARCRGYLVRQQIQAKRRAIVTIQAHARGMAARRSFQRRKANVGNHPASWVGGTGCSPSV